MPKRADVISHWHHSLEEFSTSALEFYHSVEQTMKAKEAPAVTTEIVDWQESGLLSSKRQYLRISYGRYSFDLCAAPFGRDYFFSWWLVQRQPDAALLAGCLGVMALPIVFAVFLKVAGVLVGFILFLFALGAGGVWMVSAAQRGILAIEDTILAIPGVSYLYTRLLKPITYYSTDTRLIFEESVHRVVLEHVAVLRTARQLPALSDGEKQVESRDVLGRRDESR